jgi:phosphohistidine swiveling domain-containing protein
VFQLTPLEVERLADAAFRADEAPAIAARRAESREALVSVRLPSELSVAVLEDLDLEKGGLIPRVPRTGVLSGMRVSGTGNIVGRARVLTQPEEIAHFLPGEILVARFTDPTWMTVFPKARGIVTEVGGWLSHAAIQAREYGLTGIVGATGALDRISNGDLLSLGADGVIELVPERRSAARRQAQVSVRIARADGTATGRLHDVSARGALLVLDGAKLDIGEELALELAGGQTVDARVIRNGIPCIYGVEMSREVETLAS